MYSDWLVEDEEEVEEGQIPEPREVYSGCGGGGVEEE